MKIDEIDESITEKDAAKIISDIASSTSLNIQVTTSWISNKEGMNQLTYTGVLLALSAMYQVAGGALPVAALHADPNLYVS